MDPSVPHPPSDHNLNALPEADAADLESAEGILGLLTGWTAHQLRAAQNASPPDPHEIARWQADGDRYADLWRRVHRMDPPEVRALIEELSPVARRVVDESP